MIKKYILCNPGIPLLIGMMLLVSVFCLTSIRLASAQAKPIDTKASGAPSNIQSAELDEKTGRVIPFAYDPPDRCQLVVQISINHSDPLPFLVDTGFETSLFLLPWATRQLNLTVTDRTTYTQPGNVLVRATTQFEADIVTGPDSPNISIPVKAAWTGDLQLLEAVPGPRVAGVLGSALFQAIITRFDFDKKTLTLFPGKHPPIKLGPTAISLPLRKTDQKNTPSIDLTLLGTNHVPFMVDTGANETVFPNLKGGQLPALATATSIRVDASGEKRVKELLLPKFVIGSQILPPISTSQMDDTTEGKMGLDLLSCFRVTIDPEHNVVILEPRTSYHPRRLGAVGVLIHSEQGEYYFGNITRQPVYRTGVKPGDHLVSVDGKELKGMAYAEAALRLNGYEGDVATVIVEHEHGKPFQLQLPRMSMFATVVTDPRGFTLLKDPQKPARIIEVLPDSEADRLGLKENDQLVSINDKSLTNLIADDIQELIIADRRGSSLQHLVVKRTGNSQLLSLHTDTGKPIKHP